MSVHAPPRPLPEALARPRLVGDGPATFSTCVALERSPAMVYDVNGYYRALGVPPSATKHQIARAYHERGTDDPYLTYVVTQLLDPETRGAYDATPLGHVFLDEYVMERIRLARSDLRVAGKTPPQTVLDTALRGEEHHPTDSARWPWSYYLWDTAREDEERSRAWQESLSVALGRVGVSMQIAVGLTGPDHPEVEVVQVGRRTAIFVNEQCSITDALAQRAGSLLLEERKI